MRNLKVFLLFLIAVLTFGCASKARTLAGEWKVDIERQKRDQTISMMPADMQKQVLDGMSKNSFNFVGKNGADPKFVKQDRDFWVIEVSDEQGKPKKMYFTWENDTHLIMEVEGGTMKTYLVRP